MTSLSKSLARSLSFLMTSSLIISNAGAATLVPSLSGQEGSDQVRATQIRRSLQNPLSASTRASLSSLLQELPPIANELTVPSSYILKSMLSPATDKVLLKQKYGALVTIEPHMSPSEIAARKSTGEARACVEALANERSDAIDQILNKLFFETIPLAKNRQQDVRALRADEIAFAKKLDTVLDSILTPEQRKTWGHVHDVERFGSGTRTLRFSKLEDRSKNSDSVAYADRLALSLSMLVSVRSGQDAAFLSSQACLYDFWKAQQLAFTRRLFSYQERKVMPDAQHSEYRTFLMGRKFTHPDTEMNFLKNQITKIGEALPFLKSRIEGSIYASQLLQTLSRKQSDQLIDMMLELTAGEVATASQIRAIEARTKSTTPKIVDAALIQLRQTDQDLTALQLTLDEEQLASKAKQRDLEGLQKLR